MEPRATWSHATPARGPAVVLGLRQLARSALVQRSLDTRDHHARPRRVEARPSRRPADARRLAIMGGHPAWRISRVDPQDPRAWQPAAVARASGTHGSPRPSTAHDTSKEQRRAVPRQARGARIRRQRPQGRAASGRGVPGHEPLGRLLGAHGPGGGAWDELRWVLSVEKGERKERRFMVSSHILYVCNFRSRPLDRYGRP